MGYNWSGSLDNENSSASVDIVFSNSNRATDGDVYDTTMRIDRSFNYNAGTIHINASGIKVLDINTGKDVQEFSSIGTVSVGGSSKTLEVNGSVSFDVNYHMGSSISIIFNCSLNSSSWEICAGTITAYWSGVSNNCSYSFKSDNSFSYTGTSQTILNSYDTTHLIASGQSATEVGDYTCTLTVRPLYKATHCLRDSSGLMTDSISQSWHITKANPVWSISPSTTNLEINKTGSVKISGEFTGLKNVSQYSSNGGKLNLLGLYKDNVTYMFSGVAAGTVVVTIDAPENDYYYASNRYFTVVVSDNRYPQRWYYQSASTMTGNTTTIRRQGTGVSTKSPKLTVGNSSVISAKMYSDGSIDITGLKAGTSTLTVFIDGDDNYKEKSDTITVTVSDKEIQTWEALDMDDLIYNEIRQIIINGTYYGTLSYDSYDRDIITLNTSKTPAEVRAEKVGSTTLRIIASGDGTHQSHDYIISITVGKKEQSVAIPDLQLSVGQSKYLYYEHGYTPASGTPTFKIASGGDYISINSEIPPKVTAKAVGTATIYFSDDGNEYYLPVENSPITVTVADDTRGEQDWAFSSPQDIELGQTIEVVHTGGTLWGDVHVGIEDITLLEASYDTNTAKLRITANNTISEKTSIRIEAAGNEYFKPHYQDIEININKHKQTWTLNPSEVSLKIGESANIGIEGEMFGSANTYTAPKIYVDVEPHFNETYPYFKVIGKKTINRGQLIVSSTESTTYEDRSQIAYITVGDKESQTWKPNITEATIKIMDYVDINVSGSIYGGLYFSTESSLITITNKTEIGCRIIAGSSTGSASVKLYSPGTDAYASKTVEIAIYIKDDLMWVECNPLIYKNGNWIEMSPKIYKNGKWIPGTIWKYISKGDIYGE